ncbi:MAG: hypothetical protein KAW12_08515 [Candidatus Aminicenantes bacterium]|nr:hypothetical protein [Candidatus Aminicenantes bacterium]
MKDLNIKVKTALILIVTLLMGIIIGAMLYRAISQHKIKELLDMKTREGFARNLERAIQPTAGQQEGVKIILDKYAPQFADINRQHMEKTRELVQSMRDELVEILTPGQMRNMRRGFLRQRRFPRGPGFDDRFRQSPGPQDPRPFRGFQDQRQRGRPGFTPGQEPPDKKSGKEAQKKPGSSETK